MQTNPKAILQEIVSETDDDMLSDLLDALSDPEVEILRAPEAGLVMMTVRDCFGIAFHLGEVLVTQAEVRVGEARGYGCCMGDRPRAALALACLEALPAASGSLPSDTAVGDRLAELVEKVSRLRETDARLAALTRVEFQSMAEE